MADRRLQVFHAVAKHLSFTKAGEALCMTQPAVTFQVRQLEEHFNTRLFDRTHGRISLTPAGAVAFAHAERILALTAELESALRDMGGQVAGPLLIGASTTIADFLLPQILGEFKAAHPGVVPSLFVGNSETVQERVRERALDIGFIEGDSYLPALAGERLCSDELQVVCAPGHPLSARRSVPAAALVEHAYLSREQGSGTREVIDHYLERAGIEPGALHVVMEASSPEALKGLVAAGMGIAIVPRVSVEKEVRLGLLARIPLSPPLTRQLTAVYPRERIQSGLVGAFVQFAKRRLDAPPGREAEAEGLALSAQSDP
ncbi:MAG: LysR family transcriptional regulator [Betaproteobacteria bacterium]|nr:LysR family transcriptional regulator [Betaproteobacteria bacterium]PWB58725.1 MAG: LysR family transcriptional regulator [Betaproteobacteria bacterium]